MSRGAGERGSKGAGEQGSRGAGEHKRNLSPASLRWTRLDWLALLLLAGLVLLFHWRLITPNLADRQSYPPGDFPHQFWAFATFEARELRAGRLPLWSPYTFAGSPFWADAQSAVFYPFSLLTLILSGLSDQGFSLFALELEAIFHFWLAGSFMFLLARRVTQSRAAGFVAALVFTFSGYLTGYPAPQLAVLEVVIWLPLSLFFIDRALLDRRPGQPVVLRPKPGLPDLLVAGATWGLAILAGHPQSWLLTAYTFVAYFIFLALWSPALKPEKEDAPRPTPHALHPTSHVSRFTFHVSRFTFHVSRFKPLLSLPLIILFGLALAAIQLLPAFEYTRLSVRAAGIYDQMAGGFPLIDPVQLLLPGIVSYYSPLYVGVMGLLLAALALFYGRPDRGFDQRWIIFWGGWGGFAFLVSFGGNTFFYSPLYLVAPGFALFRGQERWAFAVAFSLSLLAGYGMQALLDQRRRAGVLAGFMPVIGWLWVGAIGLVIVFFYGLNETGWSAENPFYRLLNASVLLSLLLVLALIDFRVARNTQIAARVVVAGVSLVILFDLFTVNWQTNLYPQRPEWHTQKPPIIAALEADLAEKEALFRVHNEFRLYDNYGLPFGLQDLWGASPLRLSSYEAFIAPPMLLERVWGMLNVKYVITWRSELYVPSTVLYQEPAADGATYLHRLAEVGPRAWIVHQVRQMPAEAMLAYMAEPDFDYRQEALVSPAVSLPGLQPPAQDLVEVTSFTPNQLGLHVEAGADGLLVLSEIDYPGWRATVDGVLVPIVRANYALRAIPISAGGHEVVFTFIPLTFWSGAVISGLALLGVLFVLGGWGRQLWRRK